MKRDLPPFWMTQLAAIVIVFSIGAAMFPLGYFASYYWVSYPRYFEPDYTFNGGFEANLTLVSPIADVSVGYCDTIELTDQRWYDSVPVTLRVYNDTDYLFAMVARFGGEPRWAPASAELRFTTIQNYKVQVERETEDTVFRCLIQAYEYVLPPPVIPFPSFVFSFFGVGAFLILFGLVLASNFVRRTRESYLTA